MPDACSSDPLKHLSHHTEEGDDPVVLGIRPRIFLKHVNHIRLLPVSRPFILLKTGGKDGGERS